MSTEPAPPEWAIVEIMGHRTKPGRISEVERFGTKLLRVDVPLPDGPEVYATEFYGGPSLYGVRPCTEEVARALAERMGDPRPVAPIGYRLPPPSEPEDIDDDERPF